MVFVTGGTGFLGAHVLFQLTESDTAIRALYRSESKIEQVRSIFRFYSSDNWEKRFSKISWVKGDLLDIPSLENHMKDCSKVYHCAALVSFHKRDFTQLLKINREGTANIVNIALGLGIEKLCYVSSTAAIGGHEGEITTEESKWKNTPTTTGYSISKYSAEKEVWRGIEEGLNAVIVNPCVILGPGNWKESSLTMFQTLKKGLRHYPPGSNAIVDARDVAKIMHLLMESDISAERYLCIGSNQSFKELMGIISEELKVKAPSKLASRLLVNFVRRLLGLLSLFTGKRTSITKETVNSLFGNRSYSNEKVKKQLNFEFTPLRETVKNSIAGRIE